jgi:spore maturation protein CgeB
MRIFQVFNISTNSSIGNNRTWYINLHDPLLDLGHEVVFSPADEGLKAMKYNRSSLRANFSQKLLDKFRREHNRKPFDLFFSYLMDGMIDPNAIDEIKRTGVPTCNFSCNNAHQFNLVDELSPHFDISLHSEKNTREKFLAIGANPIWWPMASNPQYFKPLNIPRTIGVSFVGMNYALRSRYIKHLLINGIGVHAYGPGWVGGGGSWRSMLKRHWLLLQAAVTVSAQACCHKSGILSDHDHKVYLRKLFPDNLHAPLSEDELIAVYSKSHISLGFLEVYDSHDQSLSVVQHLHLRDFEAPMCGALYCTGYTEELAEMFEPDEEVLVYRSQHELLDKVRYYLLHPESCDKVRHAGRARALRDHTYQMRFKQLFNLMKI